MDNSTRSNNSVNGHIYIDTESKLELEDISRSLQIINNKFKEFFYHTVPPQEIALQALSAISDSLQQISNNLFDGSTLIIREGFNSIINTLEESFGDMPEQVTDALITLGNHGWFFDINMTFPLLWEIEALLNNGDKNEADILLINYFQENFEIIKNRIITSFPQREKILISAFNAHDRGEYNLSIPVFLAQADGICLDLANHNYFLKQNRKPKTAIFVESLKVNNFELAILSQLSNSFPISAPKNERSAAFDELNRHQVMHGEALDYGTKVNSFKAISLLNYVVQTLYEIEDK